MSRLVLVSSLLVLLAACGGTTSDNDNLGPCGPSNCNGCCNANGVCVPGTSTAACGLGGLVCSTCSSVDTCSAGACRIDPNSVWKVQPVGATVTADNNGSAWDPDSSAPDPYVVLACPGSSSSTQTPVASDTTSPSWTQGGCTAKASDLIANGFNFQMWDSDATVDDTITGVLKAPITEANLEAGSVTYGASGAMQSLSVQLSKQ